MKMACSPIETFKSYSNFNDLKEFNSHIEMWLVDYKANFSKSELLGLKRLIRFAAKVPGVANAKIGTMLKAIFAEYGEYGISRSTFKRMINKAKTLGILKVIETVRKNGSQTSNLYIFLPYSQRDLPKNEQMNHQKETSTPSKTSNLIKERKHDELDASFTSDRVPNEFVLCVSGFFDKASVIEAYWRMVMIAAYRNCKENDQATCLLLAIQAFKQMIGKWKRHRVRNPIAYFYGILHHKFMSIYFEELYQLSLE